MLKKRKILYKTYMSIVDEKNIYLFDENNKKVDSIDSFLNMFETRKGSKGIYLYFNNVKRPIMDSDGIPLTSEDFFKEYCCDLNWAKTEPFCTSTPPVPNPPVIPPPSPAPGPNPSPSPAACPTTTATGADIISGTFIKKCVKGDIVKEIQKHLKKHGFPNFSKDGTIDGVFGGRTKQMVIDFQNSKGLTPDGVVGPKTWIELVKDKSSSPVKPPVKIEPKPVKKDDEINYGSGEEENAAEAEY
jgi:hypothetical protein